jgi:hypothetical protein
MGKNLAILMELNEDCALKMIAIIVVAQIKFEIILNLIFQIY